MNLDLSWTVIKLKNFSSFCLSKNDSGLDKYGYWPIIILGIWLSDYLNKSLKSTTRRKKQKNKTKNKKQKERKKRDIKTIQVIVSLILTSSMCKKILFLRLRILSWISSNSILAKSCTVSGPSMIQNLTINQIPQNQTRQISQDFHFLHK